MSLTTTNLAAVLTVSGKLAPGDVEWLRKEFRRACSDPHRAIVLDHIPSNEARAITSFWAPAQIDPLPLPIRFRWGPNGAFWLLLAMLTAYAVIVMVAFGF
jgi:hypothetical protein